MLTSFFRLVARCPYYGILILTLWVTGFSVASAEELARWIEQNKAQWEDIIAGKEASTAVVVMGNESADVDSVASAVARAWVIAQGRDRVTVLPLVNISRSDLRLRRDVQWLLDQVKIDPHRLLYRDDWDQIMSLVQRERVELHLVDHNELMPSQEEAASAVKSIVDHHQDVGYAYPGLDADDKTIEPVSSCASLIVADMMAQGQQLNTELAALLLAAVLLDSDNLALATPTDIQAADMLSPWARPLVGERGPFLTTLKTYRDDITGFNPMMLLRRDFKHYREGDVDYGIASLPSTVSWIDRPRSFLTDLMRNLADRESVSLVMALETHLIDEDTRSKRLLVHSRDPELRQQFQRHVEEDVTLNDLLSLERQDNGSPLMIYQLDRPLKRKQLQPLLNLSALEWVKQKK